MRKILITLGMIAVSIAVAVLAVPALLDVNRYRGQIQAALELRLNRGVTLGPMSLRLIPPAFRVQQVVIKEDPQFTGGRPLAQVEELRVTAQLWPLLHGEMEISSLNLERPRMELVRSAKAVWNTSTIGGSRSPASSTPPGGNVARPSVPSQKRAFSLARLQIHDGQIAVTDLAKRQPRAIYDHIDLTLIDYVPGEPFSLVVAAHLPGKGGEELRLEGHGGPIAEGEVARTPFQGTVLLKEVSLSSLQKFMDLKTLAGVDGVLSGDAKISSEAGKLTASGTMKLTKARKQGIEIGFPMATTYNLSADLTSQVLRIEKADLTLGKTPISITGLVNTRPDPANLDLQLKAANITIAETARLLSAFGMAFTPDMNFDGRLTADIGAKGPANRPTFNGRISARDLSVTGKQLAMPVEVKSFDLTLSPSEIRSNQFYVVAGKTTLTSQFTLSRYATPSATIDATVRDPHAALNELLDIARAYGVGSLQGISGSGNVAIDLRAAATLKSLQSSEITRALNGSLVLDLSSVHVPGTDINYGLATAGGLLNLWHAPQKKQTFTNILRLTGNCDIRNGVAQTNNLRAVLDQATVTATGTANLVSQALNLRLSAILTKTFSQQVGATGLASYLSAALSDPNAQIVIPVIVTGTFRQPQYAPDVEQIARMKVKKLLPGVDTKGKPQDILSGFLRGNKPNDQNQTVSPIPDLLNELLEGKKKTQPPNKPQ